MVLKKDDKLKDRSKKLADDTEFLDEEFARMEQYCKEKFVKTTEIANREENKPHNRYRDIVPYDDNLVRLTSDHFSPPETNFVNASKISFTSHPQTFLAVQAPKPSSIIHFWHMVLQERVSVIVMITRLKEGTRRKADQYWPDGSSPVLALGAGSSVEHLSTSYTGSYYTRVFQLWLAGGGTRQVTLVACPCQRLH